MSLAFVTGGTGFIGSHVVRVLLQKGFGVRCLVRSKTIPENLQGLPVEFVHGDLNQPETYRSALSGCQALFHVAADYRLWAKNPEEMIQTNVEGTRALLEASHQAGISRMVVTSSVSAIGRPVEGCTLGVGNETMDPPLDQQIGPYKRSKFLADQLARSYAQKGYPIVIVNPATPIGSMDIKPTPTGKMVVDFLNGRMPGVVNTGLNFVDVEDVALGHWLAYEKGKIGERYILGNENLTLLEFLQKVAQVSGRRAPRWKIPYAVAWIAGALSTGLARVTGKEPGIPLDGVRMAHAPMYYSSRKAVQELGLPQTPIEQAIQQAVNWFREKGMVKP